MSVLTRKLRRDLWRTRAQVLSIAAVMAGGVMSVVALRGTGSALDQARREYYDAQHFAEIFATLTRAPDAVTARLAAIPGVRTVTTRVVKDVRLDVPGLELPAVGRMIALPVAGTDVGGTLNIVRVMKGRDITPGADDEILVSGRFAEANGLRPGDPLTAVINERRVVLHVVGIGAAPDYLYEEVGGGMAFDARSFGLLWAPHELTAQATGMRGAFNDVAITLAAGAREPEVIAEVDSVLARYGGRGAIGRADQLSNRVVDNELRQLDVMALAFPAVFVAVAAFLVGSVLSRLIATEREQIAILKAFGYTDWNVALHYLAYAAAAIALGIALGIAIGIWFGRFYTSLYIDILRIPGLSFHADKRTIRFTQSICPDCNMILDAEVFEREGKVFMTKTCPTHGECEELYFGSYKMYNKFSTYWMDGKGAHAPNVMVDKCACPTNCGLCTNHLSHSGLANIIVTNRCDLTCWYCFFYVKKGLEGAYLYEPTHEQVRAMMKTLKAEKPIAGNSIQITGGEPMLRDDITDIIRIMKEEGVDHVQMNTNGIKLALSPETMRQVRNAGVSNLYLSFDGVTPRTNPKNHWEVPYALESARKCGTTVVFVPTVIKSINDHELGPIIRYAQKHLDVVHAVNFQPVSLTGRMGKKEREKYRITIPDCIERIQEQTNGEISMDDWFPVPSCMPLTNVIEAFSTKPKYELSIHFACGAGTYVFEDTQTRKLIPLTSFVDLKGVLEYFEEKAEEIRSGANRYWTMLQVVRKLNQFVDRNKQPHGLDLAKMFSSILLKRNFDSVGSWHVRSLFLGMMHFQDKYNEDLERLQRCDIHYLTPDLRIIPFCAFNVIPEWYRDRIQKKFSIPVEEWEKAHGQTLEAGLYRGLMRRGKPEAQMGCAMSEMHKAAAESMANDDHKAVELRNGMAGA